ncbi:MAG: 30S ribosome-binding factor RbfA [Planctomycetota bacterium]
MNNRRPEKLASYIREEVAGMIQRGLDDPRLEGVLVSVTRAKVSPDLAYADVYVSLLGADTRHTAAIEALKAAAGKFRGELGRGMRTRSVPVLRFQIDEQLKKEMQVLDLLRQAEREREERDQTESSSTARETTTD